VRTLFVSVVLLSLIAGCASTPPAGVSKNSGYSYFGQYQPVRLENLSDLPDHVRSKVSTHLIGRLGEPFFVELKFAGGQYVDRASLYGTEPAAVHYKWEVPAYALNFEFSVPGAGIDRYVAQILLRDDGSVLREIDIPTISAAPQKLNLISLADALRIVSGSSGVPRSSLGAEIEYDAEIDAFVWRISYTTSQDRASYEFTRIDIEAHTGSIIRTIQGIGDF
jgi:hypothetical protein